MNNKKLFKGALVLFASILMAVSCNSNSNPNDNNDSNSNNNNNNNNTTKEKVDISLKTPTDGKNDGTSTLEMVGGNSASASSKATIALSGKDVKGLADDKTTFSIKSISGNAAALESAGSTVSGYTAVNSSDVSMDDGYIKTHFLLAKSSSNDALELNVKDMSTFNATISELNSASKYTVLTVTIEFKVDNKTSKDIVVYVAVGRNA